MTFAWYAHSKDLRDKPWIIAALFSWGVALFEYLCRCRQTAPVRPVRSRPTQDHAGDHRVTVFVPFALFYMKEPAP